MGGGKKIRDVIILKDRRKILVCRWVILKDGFEEYFKIVIFYYMIFVVIVVFGVCIVFSVDKVKFKFIYWKCVLFLLLSMG